MLDAMDFPRGGYNAVVKKRFRKKPLYTQDGMDLQLLAPFDNGTILGGEMIEELTSSPDQSSECVCHH
jgi:hypothetical protein